MEIKTKYAINDSVWAMVQNRPVCFRIIQIRIITSRIEDDKQFKQITTIMYCGTSTEFVLEKDCYDTKEELLNSLFK